MRECEMVTGAELKGHVHLGGGVGDRCVGDHKLRGLAHSSGGGGGAGFCGPWRNSLC